VPLSFGTDGVRGVANAELSPELVMALGRAAARVLGGLAFVVGRDTRISGPLLQAALAAGIASEGLDVIDVGVLPTPGVAVLAAAEGMPAAVVSASHNGFADNGIKLFAVGGSKLDADVERRIEQELRDLVGDPRAASSAGTGTERLGQQERPVGSFVGRMRLFEDATARYTAHVRASLGGRGLDGMTVVIDCANGAASAVAPGVLRELGAEVIAMADEPDGVNINDGCGSTHPQLLQARVVAEGADMGLALDGDGDRVIAVDDTGQLVDGDHLIALCALDLRERGLLVGETVVVTVMTNLGFHLAMRAAGIAVHETPVGDRHVLAALEEHGWVLGGEQSGHIIFRDLSPTGDGLMTGLQVVDLVRRSGRSLSQLAAKAMTRMPQELRNVVVADPSGLERAESVWAAVEEVRRSLEGRGRVLLRVSGTEPVVRVMVEADRHDDAANAVAQLCEVVLEALGSPGAPVAGL
jgi:phosphoglucosamine mutase